jgi:hypothetical protein
VRANSLFSNMPPDFWAAVKLISQTVGYSDRKTKGIKIPSMDEIKKEYEKLNLDTSNIYNTTFGNQLIEYLTYRATVLNNIVQHNLMDKASAEIVFNTVFNSYTPSCPLPQNKQKGNKKNYAYLTCIVNMLIEKELQGKKCNYDPRSLPTFTKNNKPVLVMSRRCDGAYPSIVNPSVIWEIKEYYYTTTFGSRVADGVYETLLDGLELEKLSTMNIDVEHLLIIDDYNTWWKQGKSYLCRIIDLLNAGYVDEVIVGKEVLTRIPNIVRNWA